MKKYILLLLIGILCFLVTFFISCKYIENRNNEFVQAELEKVENLVQETASSEERIGINTKIKVEEVFTQCGHKKECSDISKEDIINYTKEDLKQKYPEYDISKFSNENVVLKKKNQGFCDEHFVLRLGEDFVEVFKINSEEEEELYLVTNISKDYLTAEDMKKLDLGISFVGKENLNLKLEDYE